MRFPASPQFLLNAEAMGAEAVAVPFEELFLALQQGTVDGQENPLVNIQTNNLTKCRTSSACRATSSAPTWWSSGQSGTS